MTNKDCPKCGGSGEIDCTNCEGDGEVIEECGECGADKWVTCPKCDGDTRIDCDSCNGKGYVNVILKKKTVKI